MAKRHYVIALISGGKDSIFSISHCLANGHHVVALGNLHPPKHGVGLSDELRNELSAGQVVPEDLDSYMYQTIGHAVIPLYEEALGLPLYRQEISGSAVDMQKSYQALYEQREDDDSTSLIQDEAESLVPLLRRIMRDHPEANAVSTGAILSDYQRTRVETVAVRLGLVPLAYLWQYPSLPPGMEESLLDDMMSFGQDARIIKCASGGLDAGYLWENVASKNGVLRLKKAMGRFGAIQHGGLLGEGGEYETLVIDGPGPLWKKRIVIDDENKMLMQDGGGTVSLSLKRAHLVAKTEHGRDSEIADITKPRIPSLLNAKSEKILKSLRSLDLAKLKDTRQVLPVNTPSYRTVPSWSSARGKTTWSIWTMTAPDAGSSAEVQITKIVHRLRETLQSEHISADNISFVAVYLRSMDSFATVNKVYSSLFSKPNPPSRAAVGLGDRLPDMVQVMLSVIIWLGPRSMREGLHVQSRSYWAPANIGPYSQAVSTPAALTKPGVATREAFVYVAGQIPLVPATMDIIREKSKHVSADALCGFNLQCVLSLQHLWRVGEAMRVNWWACGIAFVAGAAAIPQKAMTTWEAWRQGNSANEEQVDQNDAEEAEDFDIWNERMGGMQNRPQTTKTGHKLPNFDAVHTHGATIAEPSFLMVQVKELPRECAVEWTATGVSNARVTLSSRRDKGATIEYCIMTNAETGICQAAFDNDLTDQELSDFLYRLMAMEIPWPGMPSSPELYVLHATVYTDRNLSILVPPGLNFIHCDSVWGSGGRKLAAGFVSRAEMLSTSTSGT